MKKFTIYEEVRVNSSEKNFSEINEKLGVIFSNPNNDLDDEFVTIFIPENEECWTVNKNDLVTTNRFYKHEDFYDGTVLKVRVDDKDRGDIL